MKSDEVLKIDQKSGDHALEFGMIMYASELLGSFIVYKISESSLEPGYTIVEPGKHIFLFKVENKAELQMILESGNNYSIEQIPQMGAVKVRD